MPIDLFVHRNAFAWSLPPLDIKEPASMPLSKQRATIESALRALHLILDPEPILNRLPNAVKIIAHVEMLDRQLCEQAKRVLQLHEELIENHGEESLRRGEGLSDEELKTVNSIIKRGQQYGPVIFLESLNIRQAHSLMLLRSSNPLQAYEHVIELYFPNLEADIKLATVGQPAYGKTSRNGALFIKSMTASQISTWRIRKQPIEDLVELKRLGKSIPKTTGEFGSLCLATSIKSVLAIAEKIKQDTDAMIAMTSAADVGSVEPSRDAPADSGSVRPEPVLTGRAAAHIPALPPSAVQHRDPTLLTTPVPKISFKNNRISVTPARRSSLLPAQLADREPSRKQPRQSLPANLADSRPSKRSRLHESDSS